MSDTLRTGLTSHSQPRAEAGTNPEIAAVSVERRAHPAVVALAGLLVLAVAIAAGSWLALVGPEKPQGSGVGSAAPDFTLTDAQTGKPVTLSSLRGRPVWVNFWASWCEACREEMPALQQAYDKHKAEGLVLLGVNVQESPEAVRQFVSSHAYNWTFLLDSEGRITDRYYVGGIPTHVFVGPDGTIKAMQTGDVRANLDSLLATILPAQPVNGN